MQDCYVNFFLFSVIAWFLRFSLSNTDDSVSGWISGRKKWTSGETQNKILTTFTGLSINMTHAHRYGNSYFELLMFSYFSIRQSSVCIMYNITVNLNCYLKEQHVKSLHQMGKPSLPKIQPFLMWKSFTPLGLFWTLQPDHSFKSSFICVFFCWLKTLLTFSVKYRLT